tara:strand:- start:1298 stop:1696 length:399 start_codon:yes stop_codon:yes gene_type:complete
MIIDKNTQWDLIPYQNKRDMWLAYHQRNTFGADYFNTEQATRQEPTNYVWKQEDNGERVVYVWETEADAPLISAKIADDMWVLRFPLFNKQIAEQDYFRINDLELMLHQSLLFDEEAFEKWEYGDVKNTGEY